MTITKKSLENCTSNIFTLCYNQVLPKTMKAKIHPQFFEEVQVICACGNKFMTGSTVNSITVEVCNKCHPLYTGEHRFVDTKGKVEKFQKKQKLAAEMQKKLSSSKVKKEEKAEKKTKSLRELLQES